MNNIRHDMEEINELIDLVAASASAGNRFMYSKKLKSKIEVLLKKLVQEENDLADLGLKGFK